jgi:hypothetical protein
MQLEAPPHGESSTNACVTTAGFLAADGYA